MNQMKSIHSALQLRVNVVYITVIMKGHSAFYFLDCFYEIAIVLLVLRSSSRCFPILLFSWYRHICAELTREFGIRLKTGSLPVVRRIWDRIVRQCLGIGCKLFLIWCLTSFVIKLQLKIKSCLITPEPHCFCLQLWSHTGARALQPEPIFFSFGSFAWVFLSCRNPGLISKTGAWASGGLFCNHSSLGGWVRITMSLRLSWAREWDLVSKNKSQQIICWNLGVSEFRSRGRSPHSQKLVMFSFCLGTPSAWKL